MGYLHSSGRDLAILPELETARLDAAPPRIRRRDLHRETAQRAVVHREHWRSRRALHRRRASLPARGADGDVRKIRLRPVAHARKSDGAAVGHAGCSSATICRTSILVTHSCRNSGDWAMPSRQPRPRCVTAQGNSASNASIAVVSQGNDASIRVLEKLGMRHRAHVCDAPRRARGAAVRPRTL